jgi:Putative prokaryotic signal transducing protein
LKTIRTYSMQFEADLARIALEGADIPAVVLGVGVGMRGGIGGVQLLVPEDRIEAALQVLKEFEKQHEHPGSCEGGTDG